MPFDGPLPLQTGQAQQDGQRDQQPQGQGNPAPPTAKLRVGFAAKPNHPPQRERERQKPEGTGELEIHTRQRGNWGGRGRPFMDRPHATAPDGPSQKKNLPRGQVDAQPGSSSCDEQRQTGLGHHPHQGLRRDVGASGICRGCGPAQAAVSPSFGRKPRAGWDCIGRQIGVLLRKWKLHCHWRK